MKMVSRHALAFVLALLPTHGVTSTARAQVPPSHVVMETYKGFLKATAAENISEIERLAATGVDLNSRDPRGRTPLMLAAHLGHHDAARALIVAGTDINLLDKDRYYVITIAAVADDAKMIRIAVAGGGEATQITNRYDGTAMFAATHLGHDEVVSTLIESGAPLDHMNNLNWTALIEAVVLGDGWQRHTETVRALVAAGTDKKPCRWKRHSPHQAGAPARLSGHGRNIEEQWR